MISNAVRLLPAVPALASMMLVAGAAQAQSHQSARGTGWEESGEASWYGGRHNGRRTSDGSIFNDQQMTAAHATLPLGTKVRVTVQETGQSVVVTITDRQPPKRIRVIDLSRGAASRVGILSRGTAMVTLAPARADEVEEVAEAADASVGFGSDDQQPSFTGAAQRTFIGAAPREFIGAAPREVIGAAPRRHGPPRMRRDARVAAAARPCCHKPFVVQVRRLAQRPAAQRTL
jgi:rare lipoprotein A (peptidoglycan hydrolase)